MTADWRDVESAFESPWFEIIERLNKTPIVAECPSCHAATLRVFFAAEPPERRRGGMWIWCPRCRRYMHFSSLIPEWWQDILIGGDLLPEPDWLEEHWNSLDASRLFP